MKLTLRKIEQQKDLARQQRLERELILGRVDKYGKECLTPDELETLKIHYLVEETYPNV